MGTHDVERPPAPFGESINLGGLAFGLLQALLHLRVVDGSTSCVVDAEDGYVFYSNNLSVRLPIAVEFFRDAFGNVVI